MRIFITIIVSTILFTKFLLCNDFVQVPTPYKYIHKVKFLDDNLMIVSGDSAYFDLTQFNPFIQYMGGGFYKSSDMGTKFDGPYMEGITLLDLARSNLKKDRFFALGAKFGRTGIFESNDEGKTWSALPKYEETSIMHKLYVVNEGNSELLAIANLNTSEGLIITQTNFENIFKPKTIQSQIFDFKYSKSLNRFFLASDHNEHGKVIQYSALKTSREISGLEKLRVLSVQPSSRNPAYIYVGVDSLTFDKVAVGKGIYMSIDTGKTWKYLTGNGMRVFDIQEHPKDASYIAAAMGTGGVGISSNFGQYFEIYRGGLPKDAEVRSVAIPNIQIDAVGMIVYPVTFQHGIYKSRPLTSSVTKIANTDSEFRLENISPNPASSHINVDYYISTFDNVQLQIINNLGQVVFSSDLGMSKEGYNSLSITDLNLSNGIYYLRLISKNSAISKTIIVSK